MAVRNGTHLPLRVVVVQDQEKNDPIGTRDRDPGVADIDFISPVHVPVLHRS
jgi:hypothetical protein